MNVTYSEKARQDGEAYALLQQATKRLEEVLGRSAGLVKAEWDRAAGEEGRPVYTLRISDGTDSATATFPPDDLRTPSYLLFGLYRLWDDVLRARSHRHLEAAQRMSDPES